VKHAVKHATKHAAWMFASAGFLLGSRALADDTFSYDPPGVLVPGSGDGRADDHVYVPGLRFPIETGPAYLNSQVWGHGGNNGPGGGQCDPENRQYPWHDNYCETRSWDMPLCPAGTGHQGQDMRAGTCEKDTHWVVAGADGTVSHIGSYTVYVTTDDGTRLDYLHMGSVQVNVNDVVKRGDRLGKVSNVFGDTPTTIHLHFNIQQNVEGIGTVFVPPYMSLVAAYQAQVNTPPEGELQSATCERVRGAARDPDAASEPTDLIVSAGGPWDDVSAVRFGATADRPSAALCDGAATCAHGFDEMLPVLLLDGKDRDVHVYAVDTGADGAPVELAKSPAAVACAAFSTKDRQRRLIDGDALFETWEFSLFFDQLPLAIDDVEDLTKGKPLPAEPQLIASEDGSAHWIFDGAERRAISDDAMFAFRLDPASAEVWSAAQVSGAEEGLPWPSRPVLVQGKGKALYLLDVGPDTPAPTGGVGSAGGGGGGGEGGSGSGGSAPVGCACRTTQEPQSPAGSAVFAFALGLLAMRYPRRRERATRELRAFERHPR
jgi:MYXO-CTERM domain-containing protein